MNSARLLRVADHLDTIECKDFNLCSNKDCAIGHACRLPYFKRIGLKYDAKEDLIKFGSAIQNCAIAIVFDITKHQAEDLFCGNLRRNPTPKRVAKAIRKFVNAQ